MTAVILLLLCSGITLGQDKYIGFQYPPTAPNTTLSNGLLHKGTSALGETNDWSISEVGEGKKTMLWLERRSDVGGNDLLQVRSVLSFNEISREQELIFGVGQQRCRSDKSIDLVALVRKPLSGSARYVVVKAWQADTRLGRFVPVAANRVTCTYEKAIDI